MERARATWTDERLDDLARRIDDGFNRVDTDIRALSARIDGRIDAQGSELGTRIGAQGSELGTRIDTQGSELGARIDAQGFEMSRRFDRLDARIDALQRTMIQVGGGMTVAILATLVSVLATRA